MKTEDIKAVIGTNAWGNAVYEKLLRGSAVDEETLKQAIDQAKQLDLSVYDTAQDYGLGKCQPMIGRLCGQDAIISCKYTPVKATYVKGQVRASLEKDLKEMRREYIDIYWLHLPNAYEKNLNEMIELYKEGKIRNIGISNFNFDECRHAKEILEQEGVPLYGVQNHYSLINREWEKNGLVSWCKENHISFWAWAVLEEGILAGPKKRDEKWTILKVIFNNKRVQLDSLFALMDQIGKAHDISIAQVAMAFVSNKGIVPVCGCRKPQQITDLYEVTKIQLTDEEVKRLEDCADRLDVKIFGKDIFRFAVKKEEK